MKYISINKEVETPAGFLTSEAIVRITSVNNNVSINNEDTLTGNSYIQTTAYKSLEDFEEKHEPITIKGMPMAHSYQENLVLDLDAWYDKVAASLVAAGYPCLVEETIPV